VIINCGALLTGAALTLRSTDGALLTALYWRPPRLTQLYTELRSAADSYCSQDCLDRIYQWSLTWQLQISSQKCCVIAVGKSTAADDGYPCLGNERLTVSESVRDLGAVVDSHLCFSEHIANIVRKGPA